MFVGLLVIGAELGLGSIRGAGWNSSGALLAGMLELDPCFGGCGVRQLEHAQAASRRRAMSSSRLFSVASELCLHVILEFLPEPITGAHIMSGTVCTT
jgi:hypothetical protein